MNGRREFGGIRRRANGKWQATYAVNGKNYSAGVFSSKGRASAELAAIETRLRERTWVEPSAGRMGFGDYAEGWLRNRTDLRPRSRDQYSSLLRNHVIPHFGHLRLAQVSAHDVRSWHAALLERVPGTAPPAYRLLRAIFNTAVQDELISRSPCKLRGAGSDRAGERPLPSVAEVHMLVESMPEKLRLAVLLAAGGGLRRGEVLGLQRCDIDSDRGAVRVERALVEPSNGILLYGPTKNGESRTVHLSDDVLSVLEGHLNAFVGPEPEAPLFTGRTGRPLRPGSLGSAWDKAREATGLTQYHFHDLRHFSATQFSTAGASMREVMARGGWKSPAMVVRYQHATTQRDAELAKSLPPIVPPGRPGAGR